MKKTTRFIVTLAMMIFVLSCAAIVYAADGVNKISKTASVTTGIGSSVTVSTADVFPVEGNSLSYISFIVDGLDEKDSWKCEYLASNNENFGRPLKTAIFNKNGSLAYFRLYNLDQTVGKKYF